MACLFGRKRERKQWEDENPLLPLFGWTERENVGGAHDFPSSLTFFFLLN
jgi:hypothetical protein